MHGTIFLELERYVEDRLGSDAWGGLLAEAGMRGRVFTLLQDYPDEDAIALVSAASRTSGKAVDVILEDFGAFIAEDLLQMYWGSIEPEWKTLDVIEHAEHTIHAVVRLKNPGAKPPTLEVSRIGRDEVVVDYRSARRMCSLARGIVRGLAEHYGERVTISEAECMHRGNDRCSISVRIDAPV